jgi:hypothetical protein
MSDEHGCKQFVLMHHIYVKHGEMVITLLLIKTTLLTHCYYD